MMIDPPEAERMVDSLLACALAWRSSKSEVGSHFGEVGLLGPFKNDHSTQKLTTGRIRYPAGTE